VRRQGAAFIAIKCLRLTKFYTPVLLAYWLAVLGLGTDEPGTPLRFLGILAGVQIASIVSEWFNVRYEVTPHGIRVARGIVVRNVSSVAWPDIVSLQVSKSPLLGLFGSRRVTVGTGARDHATVTLEVVDAGVAERIQIFYSDSRPTDHTPLPVASDGAEFATRPVVAGSTSTGMRRVIFVARPSDYLLIALTYGQSLLFIPAALGIYSEVFRGTGAAGLRFLAERFDPSDPATFLLSAAACLGAALSYGLARSYMTYRSFKVVDYGQGLEISGGFTTNEKRAVSTGPSVGVRLTLNPVMRIFRSGRLSVLSQERGLGYRRNTVLPVADLPHVEQVIADYFPASKGLSKALAMYSGRRLGASLATVAILGLCVAGLLAWRTEAWPYALLLAFCLIAGSNYILGTFAQGAESNVVFLARGYLWISLFAVAVKDLHSISYVELPLTSKFTWRAASLKFYDGKQVRVVIPAMSKTQTAWLASLIRA
jgi:uncharacterized membrane protein YdbT with pleckstrin-like domain